MALAPNANAAVKADGKIVVDEYWTSKDNKYILSHHAAAR